MKNKNIRQPLMTAIALCLLPGVVQAQTADAPLSEIIVTGTRANTGLRTDLIGTSVSVIDSDDMQYRQVRTVSDVLRDVPGIAVSRTGAPGGLTQIRMRGAEGNHTLVLIDGIEASDPFQGEFDFATLIADDVARIEVLRGQQSALYGSDAIGGVIHYITASGKEAPGASARVEGGSFGTVEGSARVAGVSGGLDYAISGGYGHSDGTPTSRFGSRRLKNENGVASVKLGYEINENVRLKAVGRYSRTEAETNPQDFNFPPGPTYGFVIDGDGYYTNKALYGLVRGEVDMLDGRWTHALTLQGNDSKRRSYEGGAASSFTNGSREKASYESTLRFGDERFAQSATFAADIKRDHFQNLPTFGAATAMNEKRHMDNTGFVGEYNIVVDDRLGLGAAIRHDDNDHFDDATTYRLQGSYRFDGGFRLRGAAGTGIKNPTNFELYGYDPTSFIGNPNLKPEKSEGWEAGVEQRLLDDQLGLGLTYFDSKLKNEIYTAYTPSFVSTPANRLTKSTQQGVEASVQARLGPSWRVDASYTYLDAKENGAEEVRRPPHIASLNLAWREPSDLGGATLTVRYNGKTYDNNFTNVITTPRVRMDAFTLVNFSADWKLTENVQLFGRVENLFDEKYEEVFTFRTPGRAGYAGVRVGF